MDNEELNHSCMGVCSGWADGYKHGLEEYRKTELDLLMVMKALRKVCLEIDGLNIAEHEIRQAIGNTNWEVLKYWKRNGLDTIAKIQGGD